LTGAGFAPRAARNWKGQPFWRRYVASFFVLPQPPYQQAKVETARAPLTNSVLRPQPSRWNESVPQPVGWSPVPTQARRPKRLALALSAAAASLVAGVVVVGFEGLAGSGATAPNAGGTAVIWRGTLQVDGQGERDLDGKPPTVPFGFRLSGSLDLSAADAFAIWTQPTVPTALECADLLQSGGASSHVVQVGDILCATSGPDDVAIVSVKQQGQGGSGPYLDLNVTVWSE
jgi:hypothetical protein